MEIFTPSPTCMLYCANHIWDWGALQPPTHLATLHPLAHPVHHVSGCHHLPTSINIPPTWNSMCMCVCLILDTPPSTHHQTTTWPSLWHPQHWSLGVLCAPLEWPCWALPSSPQPHNHQPTSWASYPWSLGVLCAHLEWPGSALHCWIGCHCAHPCCM